MDKVPTIFHNHGAMFAIMVQCSTSAIVVQLCSRLYGGACYSIDEFFDACTIKGQANEIYQKYTKDTILTSYPGTEVRNDHWDVYI